MNFKNIFYNGQAGKFICLLDEKWDLKRLFRVDNEDEKTARIK
jgi:DNA-directed RNA polymerase delta subunit